MTDDDLRRIANTRPGYATYPDITPAGDPTWPPLRRVRTEAEVRAERPRYVGEVAPDRITAEPEVEEPERICRRCGSPRWVSVSLDEGWTRLAQCVPCGAYHPDKLGPGWKAELAARGKALQEERAARQAAEAAAARITGVLGLELTPLPWAGADTWTASVPPTYVRADDQADDEPPPGEWEPGPDRCPPDCAGCRVVAPLDAWVDELARGGLVLWTNHRLTEDEAKAITARFGAPQRRPSTWLPAAAWDVAVESAERRRRWWDPRTWRAAR